MGHIVHVFEVKKKISRFAFQDLDTTLKGELIDLVSSLV